MEQLLFDYDETAGILGLDSSNVLREHIREYPHRRIGKFVRFSAEDIKQIIALSAVRPSAARSEAAPGAVLNLTPGKTGPKGAQKQPQSPTDKAAS